MIKPKHKFKVGDLIWYFTFPEDGCGGFDINQIELNKKKILDEQELSYPYLAYAYKSKDEAIGNIYLRLQELLRTAN